jgi:hypothetical protein
LSLVEAAALLVQAALSRVRSDMNAVPPGSSASAGYVDDAPALSRAVFDAVQGMPPEVLRERMLRSLDVLAGARRRIHRQPDSRQWMVTLDQAFERVRAILLAPIGDGGRPMEGGTGPSSPAA